MDLIEIQPLGNYRPAAYSPAIAAGSFIFVSGQTARNVDGLLVGPHDAEAQARQVYENLGRVLAAAGATSSDVVKVTTYFVSREDVPAAASARQDFFGHHRPAHTGVVVVDLGGPEVRIEVEIIAILR